MSTFTAALLFFKVFFFDFSEPLICRLHHFWLSARVHPVSISQRLSSVGTEIVFPAPRVLLEAERKELKYDRLMHLHCGLKMGKIVQRIMRAVCMVTSGSEAKINVF